LAHCVRSTLGWKTTIVVSDIAAHADRLVSIIDKLGFGRIHLVGHDIGGGVVQIFSVRNADRVATLGLVNSVGYDYWPVQPIVAFRTPILRQLAMASLVSYASAPPPSARPIKSSKRKPSNGSVPRRIRGWRGEIWNRRKTGEVYPESLSITAVRNEHDELTHYVGLFSEISDPLAR